MKNIALIIVQTDKLDRGPLSALLAVLRERGCRVQISERFRDDLAPLDGSLIFLPEESYLDGCELALALGGDGSVIEGARLTASRGIPLAGINFGRLGYMTAMGKESPEQLRDILDGKFTIEERVMIDVSIIRGDEELRMPHPALNEVIVSNAPMTKMLSFDLFCNGIKTQNYRADGIIIATPSGSTAYSLSAGGPVVAPSLDCMIATPLCPHSLTSRPVVFDGNTVIEIRNLQCRGNTIYVASDGRNIRELKPDDTVLIRRSETRTKLVRPLNDSFLNTLYNKMSEHI